MRHSPLRRRPPHVARRYRLKVRHFLDLVRKVDADIFATSDMQMEENVPMWEDQDLEALLTSISQPDPSEQMQEGHYSAGYASDEDNIEQLLLELVDHEVHQKTGDTPHERPGPKEDEDVEMQAG